MSKYCAEDFFFFCILEMEMDEKCEGSVLSSKIAAPPFTCICLEASLDHQNMADVQTCSGDTQQWCLHFYIITAAGLK